MQRLWTPWRMSYVGGERVPGCIFCNAIRNPEDRESLVVYTGETGLIMLNRYPYNTGHMMVVPYAHVPSIEQLEPDARAEMMELSSLAIEVSRTLYRCDGFNTGMNIGQAAGAGIADHLHLHIVPRWTGDANFMPVLGNTRVLPETLEATHARLRAELATHVARQTLHFEMAAGALVYLPDRGAFILRKLPGRPAVVPKGKIEPGETSDRTAIRELTDETGVETTIVGWLGCQIIDPPPGESKKQHATFFLGVGRESEELVEHLNRDTILITVDDLLDAIDIADLREILEAAWPAILELAGTAS